MYLPGRCCLSIWDEVSGGVKLRNCAYAYVTAVRGEAVFRIDAGKYLAYLAALCQGYFRTGTWPGGLYMAPGRVKQRPRSISFMPAAAFWQRLLCLCRISQKKRRPAEQERHSLYLIPPVKKTAGQRVLCYLFAFTFATVRPFLLKMAIFVPSSERRTSPKRTVLLPRSAVSLSFQPVFSSA